MRDERAGGPQGLFEKALNLLLFRQRFVARVRQLGRVRYRDVTLRDAEGGHGEKDQEAHV